MKKVMLIFGTRPEAIKMCPLVKEFQKDTINFKTVVCVTAQHREMLDQVLHVFDVKPEYDLNIMKQGQDLCDITSRVLLGLRDVLKKELPDIVLVHGDTTTSSAAALAAFYQQNVFLIEPLDYLPFVYLMNHSTIVLTDSGGIQEEAPGLGKPVLVMRDTTERPEALEAGTVKLVGTGYNSIIDNVSDLLENKDLYRQMSKAQNPYGDGKTSQSIVNILL